MMGLGYHRSGAGEPLLLMHGIGMSWQAWNRASTAEPFSGGEQIAVPVTIAWGEYDRLLLPRQAPRAARAMPRARVVALRGCGHVPMSDDPEQVARVLLEGSGGGTR